ncbi:glycosyltransferase [Leucobacter sp. M11]|uniref:glycosyltransferase n=1 Tax=Leucobacter sp. M11 TaxID=2993565 RepID=UPI002D7F6403|nr:hypothetical protein [Leucobacter sp. M11]MEB4615423.1 hypothetical protein [Leucobacter sp. M11]
MADIPQPSPIPDSQVRLYIAPVNFAGQGWEWARAAERITGVGATSMHYTVPGDFGFPGDTVVPVAVFSRSKRWQRAQFDRVSTNYSHVLIEAERPIFGTLFGEDPVREARALRARGITVGMVSHGSDLRLPSRHRDTDQWSPFHDEDWEEIPRLERQARNHRRVLSDIGAPVFVSTSDLMLDWPEAKLLPVVVDLEPWSSGEPPLLRTVPVVLHAPSKARIKGSQLIDPVLTALHDDGKIEYRRVEGIPAQEMPEHVRDADIVLEQFRIGNYSRAAVEALAAGRVVIGHVHDQVRDHVLMETGCELPVVEATPDTLRAVLEDILDRREPFREIAAHGPAFARSVHDGNFSASVLREHLLRQPETSGSAK